MTVLDLLAGMAARGYALVPLCRPDCGCSHPGKRPHVPGWQTAHFSADALARHFATGEGNVGWRMGMQYPDEGGVAEFLVALDEDEPGALERAASELGPLPPTLTSRSGGGGQHRIFAWPFGAPRPPNRVKASRTGGIPGVDVRAQGGQIVIPPSIHASGVAYEWTHGGPVATLPDAWVKALLPKEAPDAPRPVTPAPTTHGNGGPLERARAAVASAPNGAQRDTLNREAYTLGGLVAAGRVDADAAREALLAAGDAMPSYDPSRPWRPEDVERIVEAALAEGYDAPLEAHGPLWAPPTPEVGEPVEGASGIRLVSGAAAFEPRAPIPYVIQAFDMAPGPPAMLAGYGFSGKSLIALSMAFAVVTGADLWGRFPVTRGSALFLDWEAHLPSQLERLERMARAAGVDAGALRGLDFAPLPGLWLDAPDKASTYDAMRRALDGRALAVFDSYRAAAPTLDENASESRWPLDLLNRVSEATGCACLVIHHARKPPTDGRASDRMSIRGTSALYDACSTVLVASAEKREPIALTHEKAKYSGVPHDDLTLEIEDVPLVGTAVRGLRIVVPDARALARRVDDDVAVLLQTLETAQSFTGFGPGLDAFERWRRATGLPKARFTEAFERARSASPALFLDEGRGQGRTFTSLPNWQIQLAEDGT